MEREALIEYAQVGDTREFILIKGTGYPPFTRGWSHRKAQVARLPMNQRCFLDKLHRVKGCSYCLAMHYFIQPGA